MRLPARQDLLVALVAIVSVAPLFATEFLPITDLPEHVAVMASLRHFSDPAWRIAEHYTVDAVHSQYLLYHGVGALLTYVVGSAELANRLLLAAVGLAYPFALRALLRAYDRDPRLCIVASFVFWNRALVVGFLPYVASVPVLLYALALAVRRSRVVASRRAADVAAPPDVHRATAKLALLALVLFYLHVSSYVILSLVAGAAALFARGPWLERARGLVWIVPSAVCALVWSILGKLTFNAAAQSDSAEIARMSVGRSARAFGMWTSDIWLTHADEACAALFWAAYLLLLASTVRRGQVDQEQAPRWLDPVYVPFLCTLVAYLFMPFRVGAAAMLNVRLAPILTLFAVLPLRPRDDPWTRGALATVVLAVVGMSGYSAWAMRAAARDELGDFGALLEHMTTGSRLMTLNFESASRYAHFPPWIHAGAYHRARAGGVAAYSFSELQHWPLHFRREAAPPVKADTFWEFNPCVFRNAEDGPYYDYVLVRGPVDPFAYHPPGPRFERVATSADFILYAKVAGADPWPPREIPDLGPCRPFASPYPRGYAR